jgi:hypothetical protein
MDELHGIITAYEMRTGQENLQKVKQHSKSQNEQKTMNIYRMKATQTYPMRKKKTSLRNLRNDLENTKGRYLSNAAIKVKLDTFPLNVLIPRKKIVKIKKPTIKKGHKKGKSKYKKKFYKKKEKKIILSYQTNR